MRDIGLLSGEIALARAMLKDKVVWAPDYSWIGIDGFNLPPSMSQPATRVLVIVPENYGYGEPYKDCFIDPGLRVRHPVSGQWVEVPHYFDRNGLRHATYARGWRYMCIHQNEWRRGRDNICAYLKQVYTYLSNPFWTWEEHR